jgi:hypothetical protein
MNNEELKSRMFNLRADLIATNLAIDAICASMSPEAHAKLLSTWAKLDDAHQKTMDLVGQAPEDQQATAAAKKRMGTRLAMIPSAVQEMS